MGLAGRKMAAINPVTKQIAVIVSISGYIEMEGCAENLISVSLDGSNLAGVLVDFNSDSRREFVCTLRYFHFNHFGRGLAAVNRHHFKST